VLVSSEQIYQPLKSLSRKQLVVYPGAPAATR
jgi:hypothetical protein